MNGAGFCLLWGNIVHSSLWINESKETKLLWITILALKNSEGVVKMSVTGLKDAAKLSIDECKASLKVLLSPDLEDNSKVEEGRRLREIPGGWQVVNHDMYRFSTESKREFWRLTKAAQRSGRTIEQQQKFEAWEKSHPNEAVVLKLKAVKKQRNLTKSEQARLAAAHKDQCEAMKHLNNVQKSFESDDLEESELAGGQEAM